MASTTPAEPQRAPSSHSANSAGHHADEKETPTAGQATPTKLAADISKTRRGVLLACFALAQFVDVVNVSAMMIATARIAEDIKLDYAAQTWVLTAYAFTFAGFLLFSGRLADIFNSAFVFEFGFAVMSILSLVVSFISNKYAFLIIRALTGISGSMTIPSAINLIVRLYPDPYEQQQALSLFGLSGAIANCLGLVFAGVLMLASWRWIFRMLCIVAALATTIVLLLLPAGIGRAQVHLTPLETLKMLDPVGTFSITSSLLLLILSLTEGNIEGWSSAIFIAPFTLSIILGIFFFVWEARLDEKLALLPAKVWKIPGFGGFVALGLLPYAWWGTTQLQNSVVWQLVNGYSPILVAARMLPQGIAGLVVGGALSGVPALQSRPKINVPIGVIGAIVGVILITFSNFGRGSDYWKFDFTGFIIGSSGTVLTFLSGNNGLIMACPPEMAGVAGAWFNTLLQVGAVLGLSVQAAVTVTGDGLTDWHSSQAGWWYIIALEAVVGLYFLWSTWGVQLAAPADAQMPKEAAEFVPPVAIGHELPAGKGTHDASAAKETV